MPASGEGEPSDRGDRRGTRRGEAFVSVAESTLPTYLGFRKARDPPEREVLQRTKGLPPGTAAFLHGNFPGRISSRFLGRWAPVERSKEKTDRRAGLFRPPGDTDRACP